jgi:hypothetical protein
MSTQLQSDPPKRQLPVPTKKQHAIDESNRQEALMEQREREEAAYRQQMADQTLATQITQQQNKFDSIELASGRSHPSAINEQRIARAAAENDALYRERAEKAIADKAYEDRFKPRYIRSTRYPGTFEQIPFTPEIIREKAEIDARKAKSTSELVDQNKQIDDIIALEQGMNHTDKVASIKSDRTHMNPEDVLAKYDEQHNRTLSQAERKIDENDYLKVQNGLNWGAPFGFGGKKSRSNKNRRSKRSKRSGGKRRTKKN